MANLSVLVVQTDDWWCNLVKVNMEDLHHDIISFIDSSGAVSFFRHSTSTFWGDDGNSTLFQLADDSWVLLEPYRPAVRGPYRGGVISEDDAVQWILKYGNAPPDCDSFRHLEVGVKRQLENQSDESVNSSTVAPHKPCWNSDRSELSYRGVMIRHVRPIAKQVRLLLDAFEEEGWPERLDSPIRSGGKQKMREAVASLNRGLLAIRFRADGSGEGILWEVHTPPDETSRNTD
ncbi:MAG: hypothetical protein ACKVHE_25785 [Planctomycetales bacterium]